MNTVTLGIATREAFSARAIAALNGSQQGAFVSFETPELLLQTLTQLRWNIIKAMTGSGPLSLREVARRVERDVKRVSDDVHALLNAGVLERNEDGSFEFPYDAVHVDFMLKAA